MWTQGYRWLSLHKVPEISILKFILNHFTCFISLHSVSGFNHASEKNFVENAKTLITSSLYLSILCMKVTGFCLTLQICFCVVSGPLHPALGTV